MASFQQVTQQADAKAGTMATVHVGLAALVATKVGSFAAPVPTALVAVLFWLATFAYLLSFAVSGYLLVQVIVPRTGRHSAPNRFSLDVADRSGAVSEQLAAQAWATADAIAQIASLKNGYAARAVSWVAAMVVVTALWLVLAGAR
ncbi:hypothetical protein [Streptomyces lasiicapitis]|uniref:hypothetical protein n=1 Tax=Streptomyces lasiicapitis TaxID=1923961 RepID=UPI003668FF48